jgi:hypothetical protein
VGQHLVRVPAIRAHAGDTDLGQLPQIPIADLGGRDLELLANASQEAAHNLPLCLQGTGVGQVKG